MLRKLDFLSNILWQLKLIGNFSQDIQIDEAQIELPGLIESIELFNNLFLSKNIGQ